MCLPLFRKNKSSPRARIKLITHFFIILSKSAEIIIPDCEGACEIFLQTLRGKKSWILVFPVNISLIKLLDFKNCIVKHFFFFFLSVYFSF